MDEFNMEMIEEAEDQVIQEEDQVVDADPDEEKKYLESKREAARRFKERREQEKKDRQEGAVNFMAIMKDKGLWDEIPEEQQKFLENLAVPPKAQRSPQKTELLLRLFGGTAEPGAEVTLIDAFRRTQKSKAQLDAQVKKWDEKGIKIEFTRDEEDLMNSVYRLVSVG